MLMKECVLCASSRMHYLFSLRGSEHRVVRCDDCGLISLNPQPSDEQLTEIRREMREATIKASRSDAGRDLASWSLNVLLRYTGAGGGSLLEIGFGRGALREQAEEAGYRVTGVEDIASLAGEKGKYDVCAFSDVIEHVRDPRVFLKRVHELLKPGGVVLLTAPQLRSWSATLTKSMLGEFRPDHLTYFNEQTLQSLLCDEGFGEIVVLPRKASQLGPGNTTGGMSILARSRTKSVRKKLSIVMPAYNEASTISTTLDRVLAKELKDLSIEVIIVESASTDGTREIVEKYRSHPRVKLIFEDRPRGKGHAVRTGFKEATGDFILIQDADLEYDLEDYEVLLEPLIRGETAFVLGARHGGKAWKMREFEGEPLQSMLLNFGHWLFATMLNVLFFVKLKDPFTMYKVFRRDCLFGLTFECNRFDFDFELLIKLVRKGYRPIEIPVNYRSRSFSQGKKVSVFRDPLTWLRALVKFRLVEIDLLKEVEAGREIRKQKLSVAGVTIAQLN